MFYPRIILCHITSDCLVHVFVSYCNYAMNKIPCLSQTLFKPIIAQFVNKFDFKKVHKTKRYNTQNLHLKATEKLIIKHSCFTAISN